jgi:general stress protein 26
MSELTPERVLNVAKEIVTSKEFCFLVTLHESGRANARVMQPFPPEEDWTIWFGASPESRKVEEILEDDRVTVGYERGERGAYVTLVGTASVRDDADLRDRYWRASFADYWPDGPGEDYVLIEFVPSRMEVMDISREVTPEPFGLQPAVLLRGEEGWSLAAEDAG